MQRCRHETSLRLHPVSRGQRIGRLLVLTTVVVFGGVSLGAVGGLRLNLTASMPPGIYAVVEAPLERGAMVLACLPPLASAFAEARGFIPRGSCSDGRAPVGKMIGALPGDTVDVRAEGILADQILRPLGTRQMELDGGFPRSRRNRLAPHRRLGNAGGNLGRRRGASIGDGPAARRPGFQIVNWAFSLGPIGDTKSTPKLDVTQ
jgi:type IV secretory pathway protease TraF